MNSFTLGRYIPIDSFMHKFDPRAKISALFLMMISIFMPAGFIGYIGIVFVMFSGARRLEIRQDKNYGEDKEYKKYKKSK